VKAAEQAKAFVYLGPGSVIQIPKGKTTALMLALSKIVRILRLATNVFQQLREIF